MLCEGIKVIYNGKNYTQKSSRGVCVSDVYHINGIEFINVRFGAEIDWHPVNIKNLTKIN